MSEQEQIHRNQRIRELNVIRIGWLNSNQSSGLGDTVEKITEATGIKKAVKFIAGEDCGCNERKR